MIKTYNTLKNDCQKTTFYDFIKKHENGFKNPINDGFTTQYKSKGGSIILTIDDTHPTQIDIGTYRQKITPKNTVKIYLNVIVSSFFGIKKKGRPLNTKTESTETEKKLGRKRKKKLGRKRKKA